MMGCELRPVSDGLYELFFVRSEDPHKSQGVFSTFPSLNEYSAKDLYSKHPTKEGLWLYDSRDDDILIFSNNEHFHPEGTESILNGHPAISAAIVYGHGRSKAALLIEARMPPGTDDEKTALLGELWPVIEVANEKATSSQCKITKDLVLFAAVTKPVVRAAKDSIVRKKTLALYKAELDRAFDNRAKAS